MDLSLFRNEDWYKIPEDELKKMRKSPQFPKHYLTQTEWWMYPKKEVEAFLKEYKDKKLTKGNENE
jgi:hypothetical protein